MVIKRLRFYSKEADKEVKALNKMLDEDDRIKSKIKKNEIHQAWEENKIQNLKKHCDHVANKLVEPQEEIFKDLDHLNKAERLQRKLETEETTKAVDKKIKKDGIAIFKKGKETNSIIPGADDINTPGGAGCAAGPFSARFDDPETKVNQVSSQGYTPETFKQVNPQLSDKEAKLIHEKATHNNKMMGNIDETTSHSTKFHEKYHLRDFDEEFKLNKETGKVEKHKKPFHLNQHEKDPKKSLAFTGDGSIHLQEAPLSNPNKKYVVKGTEDYNKAIQGAFDFSHDYNQLRLNEERGANAAGTKGSYLTPTTKPREWRVAHYKGEVSNRNYDRLGKIGHYSVLSNGFEVALAKSKRKLDKIKASKDNLVKKLSDFGKRSIKH